MAHQIQPIGISTSFQIWPDFRGVAISTTSLGSAQVTRQTIGTALFTGNSITLYSFTANITNFNAIGGVTYWFSPYSHTSSFDPMFAWVAGTGTIANSSFQQHLVSGSISGTFTRQQDRAFALSSTVPEPVTNLLVGFVLMAIAIMHQRFRPLRSGTTATGVAQSRNRSFSVPWPLSYERSGAPAYAAYRRHVADRRCSRAR